jgi:hypothetical protein
MGALALGRSCGGNQAGKYDVKPSEFAIQQCEGSISETVFGCRCSPDWLCGLPGTVHMTAVGVIFERDAPQLCQHEQVPVTCEAAKHVKVRTHGGGMSRVVLQGVQGAFRACASHQSQRNFGLGQYSDDLSDQTAWPRWSP